MKSSIDYRHLFSFALGSLLTAAVLWSVAPGSTHTCLQTTTECSDGSGSSNADPNTAAVPAATAQRADARASSADTRPDLGRIDRTGQQAQARAGKPPNDLSLLSKDELRGLSHKGDVVAMLALTERLFAPDASFEDHNEGFDWLDEAGARGSIEAVIRHGEETLRHTIAANPGMNASDLRLFQRAAAHYLVAAMMMGDQKAIDGITAVLPSNLSSYEVMIMLRGGFRIYQLLMAQRAYLGLPPYVAEFPPYDVQGMIRAINLGREGGG